MICDAPQILIGLMWCAEHYSESSLPDPHLETLLISNHLSSAIYNCPPQAGSLAFYAAMHCLELKITAKGVSRQTRGI